MTRRPLRNVCPWTAAEDSALRELLNRGGTVKAIARRLGRSDTTINKRIKLLKLRGDGAKKGPGCEAGVREVFMSTSTACRSLAPDAR
jgi:transposase-like protein